MQPEEIIEGHLLCQTVIPTHLFCVRIGWSHELDYCSLTESIVQFIIHSFKGKVWLKYADDDDDESNIVRFPFSKTIRDMDILFCLIPLHITRFPFPFPASRQSIYFHLILHRLFTDAPSRTTMFIRTTNNIFLILQLLPLNQHSELWHSSTHFLCSPLSPLNLLVKPPHIYK